jgi:hypothetical protein
MATENNDLWSFSYILKDVIAHVCLGVNVSGMHTCTLFNSYLDA